MQHPLRRRWVIWLLFVATCAAGLRDYRVDNAIESWMPDLMAHGAVNDFLIIGGFDDRAAANRACQDLQALDAVGGCLSPDTCMGLGIDPQSLLLSADGQYAGVMCFTADHVDSATFLQAVDQTLDTQPNALQYAGPPVFRSALNDYSQRRLPLVMGLIVVVGCVLTALIIGDLTQAVLAMAAITTAQVAVIGLIAWTGRPVDMTLSMIPPLMLALGFSYAAHHSLRPDAGSALRWCAATTALGFGCFIMSDLQPIRVFALWSVVGLLLTWFAVVSLTPTRNKKQQIHRRWRRAAVRLTYLIERHARFIMISAVVLTLCGAFTAATLRIEADPIAYFPRDSRIARDYQLLDQSLTGMLPSVVTVHGDADAKQMLFESPSVRYVLNVGQLDDAQRNNYLVLANKASLPELIAEQPHWQGWAQSRDVTLTWTGVAAQLHRIGELIVEVAASALPGMAVVVAVAMWCLAHRVLICAAGLWINLMPLSVLALAAWAIDWPLGLPALMIGAIAIGMAVDDTIHITATWRERGHWRQAMKQNFRACVGSSLVASACLMMFALSPFAPTAQFGMLLALSAMGALVGDMIVYPAVLSTLPRKSRYRGAISDGTILNRAFNPRQS